MSEVSTLIQESAQRIFSELADPQTWIRHKGVQLSQQLWSALEEAAMPLAWVPESLGGVGLSFADAFGVVRAAGRHALAVPLVDAMVAAWVQGQVGWTPTSGQTALAFAEAAAGHPNAAASGWGVARAVPFGLTAQTIVVLGRQGDETQVARFDRSAVDATARPQVSGEPTADLVLRGAPLESCTAPAALYQQALNLAATCRALQIGGALESMLSLSVAYAQDRVAFERPIAKFQAVQQNLARLGGEVAAALAASESAADALATGADADATLLEVAAAKLRCGEAAEVGSAIAHQVLGAIGYTEEHVLHRYSLRALSWREDFGDDVVWSLRAGELIRHMDSTAMWQLLSSR